MPPYQGAKNRHSITFGAPIHLKYASTIAIYSKALSTTFAASTCLEEKN